MNHYIEIRSLNLKHGKREEFHRLYIEEALPLLKRWNFDVVAHGPSLHDVAHIYGHIASVLWWFNKKCYCFSIQFPLYY